MRRIPLLVAILLFFHSKAFTQYFNAEVEVPNKLKSFLAIYNPEKAYLQFDRPYYTAGDTIYFKAYVTEGERHLFSKISGVLKVDLLNTEYKIVQSIKLLLDSGISWGDFALPDSLLTGNYHIRAYTNWMQNFGENSFFEKTIPIGSYSNRKVNNTLKKEMENNKADIQFFPEGGTLVEEVHTKIAFKAIGPDGLSINAKGILFDNENKTVCTFETVHAGMGYFFLKPEKNNSYKAKISFSDGTQNLVDLPKIVPAGIAISVNNDSDQKLTISTTANASYFKENNNKNFLLVINAGEKTLTYMFKQDVPKITFDIDKKLFKTGIATLTLFSENEEPLCERLFFVKNNDPLHLEIQAENEQTKIKGKVNLKLIAKSQSSPMFSGHLSMSIIDERLVPNDEKYERNILTELLLSSELKGYVENPNYYFNDSSEEARNNLDILMLTQGYRDFEWKQVLDNHFPPMVYKPERGIEIEGKVTDQSYKPISNRTITLIPSKGGNLLNSISDSNGLFHFSHLVFEDSLQLILSAENTKKETKCRITYIPQKDQPTIAIGSLHEPQDFYDLEKLFYNENAVQLHQTSIINNQAKSKLLKPVTVNATGQDNQYRTQSLAGAGHADQILHAEEIEKIDGPLSTILLSRLHGVYFLNGLPYLSSATTTSNPSPMLIVIDGSEIPNSQISSSFTIDHIPVSEIETIEVLKYASSSMYGMEGGNGVLIFTTKKRNVENKTFESLGVLNIKAKGFYKARNFYNPKYEPTNEDSSINKIRPTIYWNPEIKMDKDGHATLEYYNANSTGDYKITVEGIDMNGNIGRLVYRYKVE